MSTSKKKPLKRVNRLTHVITSEDLRRGAGKPLVFEVDHADYDPRPKTRSECEEWVGPCPYVSCKYNLFLDVDEKSGSIRINHPGLEIDQLTDTCALEVAERGGEKLIEIAKIINTSRERARQIEQHAINKLKKGLKVIHE